MSGESLDRKRLATQVDAVISRALQEQRLVGTNVLVAWEGATVLARAAGFADREEQRPVREDTVFLFSSLTKPIVSAAALALVERGLLRLDDPMSRWLPEFRPRMADGTEPSITVQHLLTHTAGLTYSMFQPVGGTYRQAGVSDGIADPGLPMQEQMKRLASVPLAYLPGSSWGYSLAIDVLGEVLARASGLALPDLVAQTITEPLGMADTGFAVRDVSRLATPYVDGTPPRRMRDPDVVPFGEGEGIHYSPSRIADPRSYPSGGAGMAGTAPDMLKFLETVRRGGGRVLKPASARAMMTNQIGSLRINTEQTPSWGFGFGGAVLMDPKLAGVPQPEGTWKWGGVYGHHWFVDPVNQLTVVALTNTAVEGLFGKFASDLQAAVYQAV